MPLVGTTIGRWGKTGMNGDGSTVGAHDTATTPWWEHSSLWITCPVTGNQDSPRSHREYSENGL